MPSIAQTIGDVPKRLRERAAKNLPDVEKTWNGAIGEVLGKQGSRRNRSKPGEAPRRQSGALLRGTKAVADPATLSISIQTTAVGKLLNSRRDRPFIPPIARIASPVGRRQIFK